MRSILSGDSEEEKGVVFLGGLGYSPKKINTEPENHNFGVPAVCFFGVHSTTPVAHLFFWWPVTSIHWNSHPKMASMFPSNGAGFQPSTL